MQISWEWQVRPLRLGWIALCLGFAAVAGGVVATVAAAGLLIDIELGTDEE